MRRLVAKAFTPRTVERLRPGIVRLTDQDLDRFDGVVDVTCQIEAAAALGRPAASLSLEPAPRRLRRS